MARPLRPLEALLIAGAVVAGGLLAYDRLRGAADEPAAPWPSAAPPPAATGGAEARGARLDALERRLADIRADLDALAAAGPSGAEGDPLDARVLERLRRQLDQIEAEREAERQLRLARLRVEQSGLDLSAETRAAVARRLAEHETALARLWTRVRDGDLASGEPLREAHERLRARTERDLRALLPPSVDSAALERLLPAPARR